MGLFLVLVKLLGLVVLWTLTVDVVAPVCALYLICDLIDLFYLTPKKKIGPRRQANFRPPLTSPETGFAPNTKSVSCTQLFGTGSKHAPYTNGLLGV